MVTIATIKETLAGCASRVRSQDGRTPSARSLLAGRTGTSWSKSHE
jgi:hypothetical protein